MLLSLDRLKMVLDKLLNVVGRDEAFHVFIPRYPLGVVNEAERLSLRTA